MTWAPAIWPLLALAWPEHEACGGEPRGRHPPHRGPRWLGWGWGGTYSPKMSGKKEAFEISQRVGTQDQAR